MYKIESNRNWKGSSLEEYDAHTFRSQACLSSLASLELSSFSLGRYVSI
jgi:hypothetical protein